MNEVFRPPRKSLYEGLACAAFFSTAAVLSPALWLIENPRHPALPWWRVWFIGSIDVIWLTFASLSIYAVAAYWREELQIDGTQFRFRGVFRTVTFDLASVTQAKWRHWPSGSLKLLADGRRLKIDFDYDDSVRLMEYLHARIPLAVQVDWPRFRHRYLVPRVVGPDNVLVDRKRIDRYLIPAALLCFACIVICGIWVGLQKAVTGACLAALCLLGFRYLIPRKGFHDKNMRATLRDMRQRPEFCWFMGWQLLFLVVLIGCSVLERSLNLVLPGWAKTTGVTIFVAGYIVGLGCGIRCDMIRERKRKAELEAEYGTMKDESDLSVPIPNSGPGPAG